MSLESDLEALLTASCARTFPDVAPLSTALPFVTWQGIGGASLRYTEGTPADKRSSLVQISVWASTRTGANVLARTIEDALCASAAFTVEPQGESMSTYEPDTRRYGALQRFTILSART